MEIILGIKSSKLSWCEFLKSDKMDHEINLNSMKVMASNDNKDRHETKNPLNSKYKKNYQKNFGAKCITKVHAHFNPTTKGNLVTIQSESGIFVNSVGL